LVPSAALGSLALWTLYKDGALADEYKDYKVLALFVHNPGLIHTTSKRVDMRSSFPTRLRWRGGRRSLSP
jgi:hypothetical protein